MRKPKKRTQKWKKAYQILTVYRLPGQRPECGWNMRIHRGIKPRNQEKTKELLKKEEEGLKKDYPKADVLLGPMVVLEV